MWLFYAIGSAFFAGVTSILAKCGIRKTDSTVVTAVRTVVVLIFSWIMVLISGSFDQITSISGYTFLFLILSGAATGASWLCYFKALQTGDVNKVVPIDKSSTVLTIILALIFLHEGISFPKAVAVIVIAAGIMLMIERKDVEETKNTGKGGWLLYAAGSAFFASLTAILGKITYRRDAVGGGDIKLFSALGLVCGPGGIILVFMMTALLSAGHAVILMARGKLKRTDTIAMAPYIAIASCIYLVFGYGIEETLFAGLMNF